MKKLKTLTEMEILKLCYPKADSITRAIDRLGYYIGYNNKGVVFSECINPLLAYKEKESGYRRETCRCDCGFVHKYRRKTYKMVKVSQKEYDARVRKLIRESKKLNKCEN